MTCVRDALTDGVGGHLQTSLAMGIVPIALGVAALASALRMVLLMLLVQRRGGSFT